MAENGKTSLIDWLDMRSAEFFTDCHDYLLEALEEWQEFSVIVLQCYPFLAE